MSDSKGRYNPAELEPRWQAYWEKHQTFQVGNPDDSGFDKSKPKYYVLDMFPYTSGSGLHVGHPEGYTATDILSRYKRMKGYNVLHPIGWDSFGLPAEQYAVQTNVHPRITTENAIKTFKRQLQRFGFSYDWSREFATTDLAYYKWTQWIFLKMFNSWFDHTAPGRDEKGNAYTGKARPIDELVAELENGKWRVDADLQIVSPSDSSRCTSGSGSVPLRSWNDLSESDRRSVIDNQRLAFMGEVPVNWCPMLGTVLSNEEVTNEGRSDRGDHPVYRRPLKQWMLRITKYCERLTGDIETVDWPASIKAMQRNWVGRSRGARVRFRLAKPIPGDDSVIEVFTTRPDTLFGATYIVLAPEHPLVAVITTDEHRERVNAYVEVARNKSDLDRDAVSKDKTGVFTGAHASNPVNDEEIPIWVADYVLMGTGTGAIMAVPAHDTRDSEFAKQHYLEIRQVIDGGYIAEFQTKDLKLHDPEPDLVYRCGIYRSEMSVGSHQHPVVRYYCTTRENAELCLEAIKTKCMRPGSVSRHEVVLPYTGTGVSVNSGELSGLATHEFNVRIISRLQERSDGRAAVNYKLRDWLFSRQRYWGEPFPILHGPDGELVALDESELPLDLPHMEDFKPHASNDPNAPPRPPLGRAKEWIHVDAYLTPQGSAVTLKNEQRAVGFSPRGPETGENAAHGQTSAGAEAPDSGGELGRVDVAHRRMSAGAEAPGSGEPSSPAKPYTRELNTMPQWAGSCWYYLRYLDPANNNEPWEREAEKYWMNVDQYVGGAEHAVLHLLYARFWHKVLYDLGYVSTIEPFQRLFNQGLIQSFAYKDKRGVTLAIDQVEERQEGQFYHKDTGEPVEQIVAKMSKALKNVVNPDGILDEFGADTFRLYEMYMGPLDAAKPWNTRDIPGLSRFLSRVWRLIVNEETGEISAAVREVEADEKSLRLLHKMLKKVGEDIEAFKLNTAIAEMIAFTNHMTTAKVRSKNLLEQFVLMLSPFAPHICEELWQRLGHTDTLAYEPWPAFDPKLAKDTEIEVPVQIKGKVRARIMLPADADQKTMESAALADDTIKKFLAGKTVRKVIVVPGKLVNIVAD